jgi:hypothetical protein
MKLTNPFGETPISVLTPKGCEPMSSKVNRSNDVLELPANVIELEKMNAGIFGAEKVQIGDTLFIRKSERHCGVDMLTREVAAFKLAEALGFKFVPATYLCKDANGDFFSLQKFVPNAQMWCSTNDDVRAKLNANKLANIYLFDYLISNSDRHGGNFLVTKDNQPVCIDHGLLFQWFSNVCYDGYQNWQYTLNEFAYRLAAADTRWLERNLQSNEYASFRMNASRIIVHAWQTLRHFQDSL